MFVVARRAMLHCIIAAGGGGIGAGPLRSTAFDNRPCSDGVPKHRPGPNGLALLLLADVSRSPRRHKRQETGVSACRLAFAARRPIVNYVGCCSIPASVSLLATFSGSVLEGDWPGLVSEPIAENAPPPGSRVSAFESGVRRGWGRWPSAEVCRPLSLPLSLNSQWSQPLCSSQMWLIRPGGASRGGRLPSSRAVSRFAATGFKNTVGRTSM